ncbi:MAG: hypothetical protein IK118_08405 [Clostridia bacterium]|nr:hypothetical protein [Clostridia bacterium]
MSLNHFNRFMENYTKAYYEPLLQVERLGDMFYEWMIRGQEDDYFFNWIQRNGSFYIYEGSSSANHSAKTADPDAGVPAYSRALQAFFYTESDYVDDDNQIHQNRHSDTPIQTVADCINVSRPLVSCWKNGSRKPDKYAWWAFAIRILHLDYQSLPPYLNLVGASVDLTCLDDVILFYSMCAEKKAHEIHHWLTTQRCNQTQRYFAPAERSNTEE